ncbi:MAG: sigma 54-interacting transcriptional regulator [Acidobacteria bacterium]|nr:sigma 54-interacting transcriptional regulator [Acidobacteriota bacterium]
MRTAENQPRREWVLLPRGVLGRDQRVEYCLNHGSISRRHCEIVVEDGRVRVRDLGSKSGTTINGAKIEEGCLVEGDTLTAGDALFALRNRDGHCVLEALAAGTWAAPAPARPAMAASGTSLTAELSVLRETLACDSLLLIQLLGEDRAIREQSGEGPYVLSSTVLRRVGESLRPLWAPKELGERCESFYGCAELTAYCAPIHASGGTTIVLYAYWSGGCSNAISAMRTIDRAGEAIGAAAAALWQKSSLLDRAASQLPADMSHPFVGQSAAFERVLELIRNVARIDNPVVLVSPRGCGKTTIAQLIHKLSARRGSPFARCDCSSIPKDLFESELFGSVRGAFTGAVTKNGLLSTTNGGTLFLDSIESCPLDVQSKLKPVLEGAAFRPVGSTRQCTADLRFLGAINESPATLIQAGRLQPDLWDRLAVQVIHIPTLAQRAEDIPALAAYYLERERASAGPRIGAQTLSDDAIRTLQEYRWPGNIRQLINVVKRVAAHVKHDVVGAEDVRSMIDMENAEIPGGFLHGPRPALTVPEAPPESTPQVPSPGDFNDYANLPLTEARMAFDRVYIQAVLKAADGNITRAAKRMGVTRRSFYRIMERCGLRLLHDR